MRALAGFERGALIGSQRLNSLLVTTLSINNIAYMGQGHAAPGIRANQKEGGSGFVQILKPSMKSSQGAIGGRESRAGQAACQSILSSRPAMQRWQGLSRSICGCTGP